MTLICVFWQSQPPEVLFEAAYQLVKDYLLLKEGYADEPRLQRTVESFQKSIAFAISSSVVMR